MKKPKQFSIVQDTREQFPLDFSPFPDVIVEVGMCWPGDYTIRGWEKSIAFERKSVSDLIGTMKDGYVGRHSIRRYEARFDQELEEFERHYDRAFVIVEPDRPEVILPFAQKFVLSDETFDNMSADEKAALAHRIAHETGAGEQIAHGWFRSQIEPFKIFAFIRSLSVTYGCHVYLASSREDAANEIVETCRKYLEARRHVIHRGKVTREVRLAEEAAKNAAAKTESPKPSEEDEPPPW